MTSARRLRERANVGSIMSFSRDFKENWTATIPSINPKAENLVMLDDDDVDLR